MDSLAFDIEKYFLGKLCKNSHEWEGTGQSLRYSNCEKRCLICVKERGKRSYEKEGAKEKKEARRKHRRAANRELTKEQDRNARRKSYATNLKVREYHKNYTKQYYQANREKRSIYEAERYTRNRDSILAYSKERFNSRNRDEYNATKRRYYRTPKGQENARCSRIKRRQRKSQIHRLNYTNEQLSELWAKFDNQCAYCGSSEELTIDHVFPISKGGADVLGNLVPCCRSCNPSKGNREVFEWFARQPFFSQNRWKKLQELIGKSVCNGQIPLF